MIKKYGCALLAGGPGNRMGQVNKANIEYKGKPFIQIISDEIDKSGMPCYLSQAAYKQSIPYGWSVVDDVQIGNHASSVGPIGGIYSCLNRAKLDGLDGLYFVPCDAPFFNIQVILKLDEIAGDADAACWQSDDGRYQTTYGRYSINCIDAIKDMILKGDYKVRDLFSLVDFASFSIKDYFDDERYFLNINTAEELLEISNGSSFELWVMENKHV